MTCDFHGGSCSVSTRHRHINSTNNNSEYNGHGNSKIDQSFATDYRIGRVPLFLLSHRVMVCSRLADGSGGSHLFSFLILLGHDDDDNVDLIFYEYSNLLLLVNVFASNLLLCEKCDECDGMLLLSLWAAGGRVGSESGILYR